MAPSASASSALVSVSQIPYTAVPSETALPAPTNYPQPWIVASDYSIACYFPVEEKDLAVISCPSFEPTQLVEFQDVTRACLATANKLGKRRLMIDLRGNGGGIVYLAYDMFKQLFPAAQPWGTTNTRAFPLMNDMGQMITNYLKGRQHANDEFGTIFDATTALDSTENDFTSWQDYYGPVHANGDTFTNLMRYNLSDPLQTGGIDVSGYDALANIVPNQTFASDDMVLLQDGNCGSTCAVFAEFMKTQGKVGRVVMGGRPQSGPMQAVGAVKGANVYTFDLLLDLAVQAFKEAPASEQEELKKKYGKDLTAVEHSILRAAPQDSTGETHYAQVNIRNNIRKGDATDTPLQFVYEAADCRLFYTAQMIVKQELTWKAAYNAFWGTGSCVKGSTNQPSSQPGTSYIHGPDAQESTPTGGTGSTSTTTGHLGASSSNAAHSVISIGLPYLFSGVAIGWLFW